MCLPEKKSSVRPLPNPPQREGTMIPTKTVSHRVLSVFRALNQQSAAISVICGSKNPCSKIPYVKPSTIDVNHFTSQMSFVSRSSANEW